MCSAYLTYRTQYPNKLCASSPKSLLKAAISDGKHADRKLEVIQVIHEPHDKEVLTDELKTNKEPLR